MAKSLIFPFGPNAKFLMMPPLPMSISEAFPHHRVRCSGAAARLRSQRAELPSVGSCLQASSQNPAPAEGSAARASVGLKEPVPTGGWWPVAFPVWGAWLHWRSGWCGEPLVPGNGALLETPSHKAVLWGPLVRNHLQTTCFWVRFSFVLRSSSLAEVS